MTQQHIDFGTGSADDGEFLSTAMPKVEANFTELYARPTGPLVTRPDLNFYQTLLATGSGINVGITAANTIFAYPLFVGRALSATKLGANVTTLGSSTNIRLGLYKDASAQPGTLIADSGALSMASTGVKEVTISAVLQPGLYWIAALFDATTGGVSGFGTASVIPVLGRTSALSPITTLQRTMTFGAYPSDESAQTYTGVSAGGAYGLWVR